MRPLNPLDIQQITVRALTNISVREPSYGMGFAPTIQVREMSAYMSTRHVKPPPPLFFFPFFLPRLSLVRPRRRLSLAPTAGCWRRRIPASDRPHPPSVS